MKFNTRYKIQDTRYKLKAQSLLEALLSIALGVILIGGSVGLIGVSLKTFNTAKQHLQANSLMRQTAEIIQSLTRDNWHNIYDLYPGIHYKTVKRGNAYVFQKGEEKIFDSQNLISYWSFDEATSTIAYDNQSTNNGTLTNGPTWQLASNCVSGSCLSFNGSSSYVDLPTITSSNQNAVTIEAWVYLYLLPSELPGSYGPIYDSDQDLYVMYEDKGANELRCKFTTTVGAERPGIAAADLPKNQWIHIVGTYSNTEGQAKIYLNGQLKDTHNLTGYINGNQKAYIGFNSPYYFNGLIDEPRIYNRALTADEIKTHYQAGLDKLGLVSYWAFDENATTTAYDSQSTNNGTLYNGPTWQSPSNCVSGSCLSFNGSTNYVDLGNPSSLQITGNQTIEMWLHPYDFAARRNPYAKAYGGEGTITQETNGTVNYYYGTGGGNITPYQGFTMTNPLELNKWTHLVLVRDLTNMKLRWYKSGVLVNETPASYSAAATSSLNAYIGKGYESNYNGLIDEPRIYNRALSADEISQRYQASYTKYFVTNKVSRTSGNIDTTYSSANDDPSTLKINSVIKYGRGLVSQQTGGIVDLRFYLTRSYNNQTFWQTDWSGGSGQTGPISNPGNKFDTADSNINYASTTGSIYMTTATTTVASLTSSILDTGVSGGAGFNSLLWQGSLGTGGTVKFQIAFSNSSSTVNTFYGPTATTDYYQPNPNVSMAFPTTGTASPQNNRYLRYKVYLSTTGTSPQVNDIIINWAP